MRTKFIAFGVVCFIVTCFTIGQTPSILYAKDGGQYKIGSGDVLEVMIWKEPDLSRNEVIVRTDGYLSFPLLNDLKAEGSTLLEHKTKIETGLKEFLTAPIATVTLRKSESKRFYILGEIQRTGEYPIVKELTILQAFALAGGFTQWASKSEIILVRNEDGKEKIYRVNYKDIIKGKDFGQNVKIKPDDTIIVP
jgi:polysaccharide export outer membrane protein